MEDLEQLVRSLVRLPKETSWVEFKRNYYDGEMVGERISGLANAAALEDRRVAYLIWGVDDTTHEIVGVTENFPTVKVDKGQEMEAWLRQRLSRNGDFSYESVMIDGHKVGIVMITPAVGFPVSFYHVDYIRIGSITRKLEEFKELSGRLWGKLRDGNYEARVAKSDCNAEDVVRLLDTAKYFDLKKQPYPSDRDGVLHYLIDDELVRKQDNRLFSITNLGAVTFAKRLSDFKGVGRKALRIVKYNDRMRLEIAKSYDLDGGYANVFEDAIKLIGALTPGSEPIVNGVRTPVSAYPEIPIRETLANALIHQDFTEVGAAPFLEIFPDRLEFSNPGVPLVNVDRIIDTTPKSRNEHLASLMRQFKICEELGTGWDKIVVGCELKNLPPPRMQVYENGTRVLLYAYRPYANWSMEDRVRACYYHACVKFILGEHLTNLSFRTRLGVPPSSAASVSRVISEALAQNVIKPLDKDAGNRYMKYIPYWG